MAKLRNDTQINLSGFSFHLSDHNGSERSSDNEKWQPGKIISHLQTKEKLNADPVVNLKTIQAVNLKMTLAVNLKMKLTVNLKKAMILEES